MTRLRMKETKSRRRARRGNNLAAVSSGPPEPVARMRSGPLSPSSALLFQIVCFFIVLINFTNAGNLDFYQDVEPELPKDITYADIARYLEAKNHRVRAPQRPRMPIVPWTFSDWLDYRRQKERILERLLQNPAILEVLKNRKIRIENRGQVQPVDWPESYDPHVDRPYIPVNPAPGENYRNVPLAKNFFKNEKPLYNRDLSYPLSRVEADQYASANEPESLVQDIFSDGNQEEAASHEPEFTFKFPEPKMNERDKFAIRPNNPRYYEDDDSLATVTLEDEMTSKEGKVPEEGPVRTMEDKPKLEDNRRRQKCSHMADAPLVIATTREADNDIFLLALVAGGCAATMFILVLIVVTWCRIHRGAKAAADIEYPAYGVTGPNKDISPSGDQRLAHSAQMYHFQHQKQQIIAMENRTAASRDPGSVSEAESDEENEEGDYTVYECPGLASMIGCSKTGEMEVKNPMFRDDPTPATPPRNHKEEDHM